MRLLLLAVALLSACAQPVTAPRPAPQQGVSPLTTPTIPVVGSEERTGAPSSSQTYGTVSVRPKADETAPPKPTGGIGEPASYCKPGYCETPPPTVTERSVTGDATYYCRPSISRCTAGYPTGMFAAAGPELRAMLGDWRGKTVVVTDANGRGVLVQLIDWCACGGDHVIDLYWTAYQGLVNPVTVREEP